MSVDKFIRAACAEVDALRDAVNPSAEEHCFYVVLSARAHMGTGNINTLAKYSLAASEYLRPFLEWKTEDGMIALCKAIDFVDAVFWDLGRTNPN